MKNYLKVLRGSKKGLAVLASFMMLITLFPQAASAANVVPYHGILRNSSGTAITTATNVNACLFTASSGGSSVYALLGSSGSTCPTATGSGSSLSVTPNSSGEFTVLLGDSSTNGCGTSVACNALPTTIDLTSNDYYLEFVIGGSALASRQRLGNALSASAMGPGYVRSTATNSAGGSANPIDVTSTLGIMDGSDTFNGMDVNITHANHTGSSNTVTGLDVSASGSADSEATETAINISGDWDADISLANGESIVNSTDGTVAFTDGTNNLLTIVDAGTTGNVTATGTFTSTGNLTASSSLILSNAETITNGTDGTVTFSRNDSGAVTLLAADDDANAALTVSSGGTGTLTLDAGGIGAIVAGSADVTSFTVTTDSTGDAEVVLPNDSIGTAEILDDTILAGNIATGGVATAEILDGTIVTADIATGGVATGNILDATIVTGDIATGGVATGNILDATIVTADIATGGVATGNILDNTVSATDLSATLSFADADYIDLSAIVHDDTALQGLRLPQIGASPSNPTSGEGQIGWDETNNTLEFYNGTSWAAVATTAPSLTAENTFTDNQIYTFTADEDMVFNSTAVTATTGVIDLNVAAGDAAVDAANIGLTVNDGATTATDFTGLEMLLTANDADADVFGLTITGAATTNATTGTYEAGLTIDNAEDTASSMTDAILITSSGASGGVVDAIDVSASNITNALNVGGNIIQLFDSAVAIQSTGDGIIDINADVEAQLDVGIFDVNGSGVVTVDTSTDTAAAIALTTTAGGISLTAGGDTAGDDLLLTATGTATEIRLASASTTADAIDLAASAGGVDISAALDANTAIALTTTAGGIVLTAGGDTAGDDLLLTATGTATEIRLASASTTADAIDLAASAGGVDISAAATKNITLATSSTGRIDLQAPVLHSDTGVVTGAGALDITVSINEIVTTGADALTLADGQEGQIMFVVMKTDGGDGTLTPSNFTGGSTITFDSVGDTVTLLFTNGAWFIVGQNSITVG
jgi:hypothetical protein